MAESRGNDGQEILLPTLDRVPILPRYVALMKRLLLMHGATLTETGEPPPKNVDPAARMYAVIFPPGTVRVNGMRIVRSVVFEIHFPDGYRLRGGAIIPDHRARG